MSDIERMLKREQAEQKRVARGARSKKNGSKSKHCSLPSDNLSSKERAALSGPVTTYDGSIVSWETFVSMTAEEKAEFINRMQYLYKADLFMLSSAWGLDMSFIVKKLSDFNVKLTKVFPTKEDRDRFSKMVKKLKEEEKMKAVEPKYIDEEQFIALTPEERSLYVSNCMSYFRCGQRTLYAYIFKCTFNQARHLVTKYSAKIAPGVKNLYTTKQTQQKLSQWANFDAHSQSVHSSPANDVIIQGAKNQSESNHTEQVKPIVPAVQENSTQNQEESTMINRTKGKLADTANSTKKLSGEIEYTGTIQEAIDMLQHLSHVSKDGQVMLLINL